MIRLNSSLSRYVDNRGNNPKFPLFKAFSPEEKQQIDSFINSLINIQPEKINGSNILCQARMWKCQKGLTDDEKYFREQTILNCLWEACLRADRLNDWVKVDFQQEQKSSDQSFESSSYHHENSHTPEQSLDLFKEELKKFFLSNLNLLKRSIPAAHQNFTEQLDDICLQDINSWITISHLLSISEKNPELLTTEISLYIQNKNHSQKSLKSSQTSDSSEVLRAQSLPGAYGQKFLGAGYTNTDFSSSIDDDEMGIEGLIDLAQQGFFGIGKIFSFLSSNETDRKGAARSRSPLIK